MNSLTEYDGNWPSHWPFSRVIIYDCCLLLRDLIDLKQRREIRKIIEQLDAEMDDIGKLRPEAKLMEHPMPLPPPPLDIVHQDGYFRII